ncbi:MAG: class I tRNA ligase family protein, partial [Sulfolobaceae archaeon]
AVWKAWKPGEPYWESPWGKGRPGWHIECSTMSTRYLGEQFDIHGGGVDLVFPHHENERAQSEALLGKTWVKYWVHVSYLTINKEKMSKSLKNIIPLNEAIKKWGTNTLRYWFLTAKYRNTIDFSEDSLSQASTSLRRLKDAMSVLRGIIKDGPKYYSDDEQVKSQRKIISLIQKFHEALSEDFDTATALSYIHEIATIVFNELQTSEDFMGAMLALDAFRQFNYVYGVMDEEFNLAYDNLNKVIDAVVEVRNILRAKKMYDLSDQIRDVLSKAGIKLLDSKDKTTWRFE